MEVAVLGGGHGCYAAAADASEAGQNVRFWRRDAAAFRDVAERRALTILDANGRRDVPLAMVTDDIAADHWFSSFSFRFVDSFYCCGEGLAFAWLDASDEDFQFSGDYYQSIPDANGFIIEFDGSPAGIRLYEAHSFHNQSTALASASNIGNYLDNDWHSISLGFQEGLLQVSLDGNVVLEHLISDYAIDSAMFGLGAQTGSFHNDHRIDDLYLGCDP